MNDSLNSETLAWDPHTGLLPAIIQHASSGRVLMLGYMSRESLTQTQASRRVTFFSRSRQQLWTKGESSGNWLNVVAISGDCDADTLLILAHPEGPTCHLGTETCFDPPLDPDFAELANLDATIAQRLRDRPDGSYTTSLIEKGVLRVAQKVGEEGVEVALAGAAQTTEQLENEAADLLYHLGVLLRVRESSLAKVLAVLRARRLKAP